MDNALILVVEDERQIADIVLAYLEREGLRGVHAGDGQTALDLHAALKPDLVILDVKLPKRDGFEVLAELRRRGETPVIMLTALREELDKLTALRVGADDYVVKPFSTLELVARVKVVLKRSTAQARSQMRRVGRLEIDEAAHEASVLGADDISAPIDLTPTEFKILSHMSRAPRKAFSRAEIVDACLGGGEALERTVDSHISNLRRKIEAAGGGTMLGAVRGLGYRLEERR